MRLPALSLLFGACQQDEPPYLWLTPVLTHRCDLGHGPAALQEEALALTRLDPAAVAPPEVWVINLDWGDTEVAPALLTDLVVSRPAQPDALTAFVIDSPRGGCPTGTVLDAGYNVTWSLGPNRGDGALWTRSGPGDQPRFLDFTAEIPLDQAPAPLRSMVSTFVDPQRPVATVLLTVLDRKKGREVTWIFQRRRDWDPTLFNEDFTPRQWLLARGTWADQP